jgi:hypothetical protein
VEKITKSNKSQEPEGSKNNPILISDSEDEIQKPFYKYPRHK